MTGLEVLQSVQFVTVKGKRLAVAIAEDWEALIEWLETVEDVEIARTAIADRARAGWLEWDSVDKELD